MPYSISMKKIKTYKDFYIFYLSEHANKTCRILHFIGTSLVFVFAFLAIYLSQPLLWIMVPLAGYGFAWVGHMVYEKNKPATFQYPLWSLASDFKMYFHILTGKIGLDDSRDSQIKN